MNESYGSGSSRHYDVFSEKDRHLCQRQVRVMRDPGDRNDAVLELLIYATMVIVAVIVVTLFFSNAR